MPKSKILCIDDDPSIHGLVDVAFGDSEEYEVQTTADPIDGIQQATSKQPDVILLDITMPGMDGFQVLQVLKDRKIPTRVIFLTGLWGVEHVIKAIKLGACDYITKPFKVSYLVFAVKRALELEGTLNYILSDNTPLIQALMARAESLSAKNSELEANLSRRERRSTLLSMAVRLTFLTVSVAAAIALYLFTNSVDTRLLFLLPMVLFALLLLPIERIRSISATLPKASGNIELSEEREQASQTQS